MMEGSEMVVGPGTGVNDDDDGDTDGAVTPPQFPVGQPADGRR